MTKQRLKCIVLAYENISTVAEMLRAVPREERGPEWLQCFLENVPLARRVQAQMDIEVEELLREG